MKLTCLSKGSGVHYPPCHMLELCGHCFLLECPIDFSALNIFTPIAASRQLDQSEFISAEPWYKTAKNLHLWDASLIDAVLISSPAGMLGMPLLTRNPGFSAKIYATEATMRIGRLMMNDLVSMHAEYIMLYGHDERKEFPEWMGWEELEKLSSKAKEVVIGENGEELGSWLSLYSAADVDGCIERVQSLKYAEEACYNGIFVLKAFSSGLEIGSCNWRISTPRRSLVYLSSSIFESAQAVDFDYHSLQGAEIILFSDMSSIKDMEEDCSHFGGGKIDVNIDVTNLPAGDASLSRKGLVEDEIPDYLADNHERLEEVDKLHFITSCIIDSVGEGGSVLIPIGRLGCQYFLSPQPLSRHLHLLMVFQNGFAKSAKKGSKPLLSVPLFCGEPLFGHAELMKEKKVHVFPLLYSSDLLLTWKEPCIVFAPHWTLRLGPAVHLLKLWHADSRCLLILEQGIDPEMALLPFGKISMRVLECSFLSGIRVHKILPLLRFLRPNLVLLPEDLSRLRNSPEFGQFSTVFYSENARLRAPSTRSDFEGLMAADLAFRLKPRRLLSGEMAIARLRGKLVLSRGKALLLPSENPVCLPSLRRILLWGSVDADRLKAALKEKGMDCSIEKDDNGRVRIGPPEGPLVELSAVGTVVCTKDEAAAALILEALGSICELI